MLTSAPSRELAIDVDVHDLNKALEKAKETKKKEEKDDRHQLPNNVSNNLGHLDEHLSVMAEKLDNLKVADLEALRTSHIDLIAKVSTKDNIQNYEHLLNKLESQGISALTQAIRASLSDPEKIIDLCEIICLDPNISEDFRRELHSILSQVEILVTEIKEYYYETVLELSQPNLNAEAMGTDSKSRFAAMRELSPFAESFKSEKVSIPGYEDLSPEQLNERIASNKEELQRINDEISRLSTEPLESRDNSFNQTRSELINQMVHLTTVQNNLRNSMAFNNSLV